MAGGRRAAWLVVTAMLVVGVGSTAVGVARADCPLPNVAGCPPDNPQPNSPPVVRIEAASATSERTAAVSGTIDPSGGAVTYYWVYQALDPTLAAQQTPASQLPAGDTPRTVQTTLTDLEPGTKYTVGLEARNDFGPSNAWDTNAFTTSEHAVVVIARSHRPRVFFGDMSLRVTAFVAGAFNPFAPATLYVATGRRSRWRVANAEVRPGAHGVAHIPACPTVDLSDSCPWLHQNFRAFVQDGQVRSRTVTEYVYPKVSVATEREQNGYSPWLDASFEASVHWLHGRFRHQRVFFYEARSRRGPFRLVASSRLRVYSNIRPWADSDGGAILIARARIRSPTAGVTFACTRRQLLPDMGRPFLSRWCGRRSVR